VFFGLVVFEGSVGVIFVGDDWSEDHHDVHVSDGEGKQLAVRRFPEGLEGIGGFHSLVAEYVSDPSEVVIGIETDRGLWVEALLAAGYSVYVVNPLSMSRYRKVHHLSGAKSDPGDAMTLADMVRTFGHQLRLAAGDTPLAEGVKALARAHQNLIWERTRHTNRLRSALREYYPAALVAFNDLDHSDTLSVLERAPTPTQGRLLSVTQIKAALKRGGRQRYLQQRAVDIQAALRGPQLETSPVIGIALGAVTRSTVALIGELNTQIEALERELGTHFEQHPDAGIVRSLPGLGLILGARVLGEFGDNPNRYQNAKGRKNYAATSPITRASGTSRVVSARWIGNKRLVAAINQWAFCSIKTSAGSRAFYQQRRAKGDTHNQALRALGNRLVGILHGCLKHGTLYNEDTAWAHRRPLIETIAA
jgi:transposase